MFGKDFEVIKEFKPVFKMIGKYEEFYAYEKDGEFEYGILDSAFGQPSPANWDESEYAQSMRKKASEILQKMIEANVIKLMEG